MRPDIKVGASCPDYELTDHTGTRRRLSELQGNDPDSVNDPKILTTPRHGTWRRVYAHSHSNEHVLRAT
jgi:hypothetical protein